MTKVTKRNDDMFKCKCEKSFKLSASDEIVDEERVEKENMMMKERNSDASEATILQKEDVNDIPMNCFDALISSEFG